MIDPAFVVSLIVIGIASLLYEVKRAAAKQTTISEQVWSLEAAWPPFLFLAGILAGHLFTH